MKPKKIAIYANGNLATSLIGRARGYDLVLATDRAALLLLENGITPAIAIGDFDSVTEAEAGYIRKKVIETAVFPRKKDFSDLHLAIIRALEFSPESIDIYGATGTRLDHMLGAVYMLELISGHNSIGRIIDANNEIFICNSAVRVAKSKTHRYLSLLSLSETAVVTVSGVKYPLVKKEMSRSSTLGISNEITQTACSINVVRGSVAVVLSRD